jgi:hypothetical protein
MIPAEDVAASAAEAEMMCCYLVSNMNASLFCRRIYHLPHEHDVFECDTNARFQLEDGERKKFRVNCMRGSPQFIAYQDRFGVANASRLDELIFQKREEQKFNSMIEKKLKSEQEQFAKVALAASDRVCVCVCVCVCVYAFQNTKMVFRVCAT